MTEFEAASLKLASWALNASVVADILAGLALLSSIIVGVIVYRQLASARWNTLLTFEEGMQARRRDFSDIGSRMLDPPSHLAQARFEDAKEGYLNAVDRLASSILRGHFPEKELKQDYREYIASVVRDFPEYFRPGTRFRHTLKLYERWQN